MRDLPFTTLSVLNALELLGVTEYAEKLMHVCHFQERTGPCWEEDLVVQGIVSSSCVCCAHPRYGVLTLCTRLSVLIAQEAGYWCHAHLQLLLLCGSVRHAWPYIQLWKHCTYN